MKNNINPTPRGKWILGGVVILSCVSVFVGIQMSANAQMTAPPASGAVETKQGRLDERRRVIQYEDPLWSEKVPLASLAGESTAIAIVTTVSNVGRPTSEPQGVDTVYKVTVGEVIKGSVSKDIFVALPGGLARGTDGNLILSQARSIVGMRNDRTYVLFLTRNSGGNADFSTVRGSQGIYELPRDGGGVIHLASQLDPPPGPPRQDQNSFLATVRRFASE